MKWVAFKKVGTHTTNYDFLCYLLSCQENSEMETAQQTTSWYKILKNAK